MKLMLEKISLILIRIRDFFVGSQSQSLTELVPVKHVAIIMDGNNRWAKKRALPGFTGHQVGVDAIRKILQACDKKGIEVLTLFAFSSENWSRPEDEVSALMSLFLTYLKKEVASLHENGVRIRFIGRRDRFSNEIRQEMEYAESLTQGNKEKTLVLAVDFGGRWDISHAAASMADDVCSGSLQISDINELTLDRYMSLSDLPAVDLCIRTGGEYRISNFLLWQLSYAELYFTDCLWPDFNESEFDKALFQYSLRQRRFGLSAEQAVLINDVTSDVGANDCSINDAKHSSVGQ
jgi:undecaprenyl diphosphate synthase